MSDDENLEPIRTLANDMRRALERFWASGVPACEDGCHCPLSRAVREAVSLVDAVERYDRGELVADGLPTMAIAPRRLASPS